MDWPDEQIAKATGPCDTRPLFLQDLPYSRIQQSHQPYYRFIYHCARDLRPRCYVELGVLDGWGILHAKVGNPEAQVAGVDCDLDSYRLDRYEAQFPMILVKGDSIEMAPLFALDPVIDMILFDSYHDPDYLVREFKAWDRLCVGGALQMFDDVSAPHMIPGWDAIPGPKRLVDALHEETGFGIRIKP